MKKRFFLGMFLATCIIIGTFVFSQLYPVGMISLWKFDEIDGTIAYDSVDENNGTIYGATRTTGIEGNALNLDGFNDYVATPLNMTNFPGPEFSVVLWYNINSVQYTSWARIFSAETASPIWPTWTSGPYLAWERYGVGPFPSIPSLRYVINYGAVGKVSFETPIEEWVFFAGTYDGTYLRAYVNGQLVGEVNQGGFDWRDYDNIFTLGQVALLAGPRERFNGLIDEVGIFDRALAAEEVLQLYMNMQPDPGVALVELITLVEAMNLQQGIDNSLDAKLNAVLNALDDVNENNDVAAINALEAFINAVEAQRGNKISDSDADTLIAAALEIIAMLNET